MKRLLLFLLVLNLLVVPTNLAFAQAENERTLDSFFATDIETHWGFDTLDDFLNNGILEGYNFNGEVVVKPDQNITRAEVVTLFVRGLELKQDGDALSFPDLREGHWATNAINIASSYGIIQGNENGHVLADEPIKREELAAMIVRTFKNTIDFSTGTAKQFNDVRENYWASNEINKASQVGIIEGYNNNFSPSKHATRAETMVMLGRSLGLEVSNVPNDQILIDRLLESENGGYALLESGDYTLLYDHNTKYYTGFHRALANETAAMLEAFQEDGLELSISLTEALQAEVINKTDRFAVVKMTDGQAEFTVTYGTTIVTDVQPIVGTFLMKKVNNEWMIYFSDVELTL